MLPPKNVEKITVSGIRFLKPFNICGGQQPLPYDDYIVINADIYAWNYLTDDSEYPFHRFVILEVNHYACITVFFGGYDYFDSVCLFQNSCSFFKRLVIYQDFTVSPGSEFF